MYEKSMVFSHKMKSHQMGNGIILQFVGENGKLIEYYWTYIHYLQYEQTITLDFNKEEGEMNW